MIDVLSEILRKCGFDITVHKYSGDGEVGLNLVYELVIDDRAILSFGSDNRCYLCINSEEILCPFPIQSSTTAFWLLTQLEINNAQSI